MSSSSCYLSSGDKASSVPLIGLFDVDQTLFFGLGAHEKEQPNPILLQDAKARGIKDVYLFTDMIASNNGIYERNYLCESLKQAGFNVLGVSTPMDYAWDLDDKMLVEFFDRMDAEKAKYELKDATLKNLLQEEAFLPIKELVSHFKNIPAIAGRAFKACQAIDNITYDVTKKSMACKGIADLVAQQRKLSHVKGIMYLQIKMNHSCDFIIYDDHKDIPKTMKQVEPDNMMVRPRVIQINPKTKICIDPFVADELVGLLKPIKDYADSRWTLSKHNQVEARIIYKLMIEKKNFPLLSRTEVIEGLQIAMGKAFTDADKIIKQSSGLLKIIEKVFDGLGCVAEPPTGKAKSSVTLRK